MITLYTAATGNGHRASIMLEETALAYRVVPIDFAAGEHQGDALRAANPLGQIPAIVDPDGPDGALLALGESAAIVRYLARKSGRLLPAPGRAEAEAERWSAIAAGGLQSAPTTIFHARLAGADAHAGIIAKQFELIDRYLAAIEARLAASAYLAGDDYSYADILVFTLAHGTLPRFDVDMSTRPAIQAWAQRIAARPAVQRGLAVPGAA